MHDLQSLLRLLALSLKWLVRPSGKGLKVREHGNVVRPMVGSVAAERACNARGSSYLRTWGRGCRSPGFVLLCLCPGCQATGGPILLYFLLLVSVPLIIGPYHLVPRPMFVPKRRSQQGVVVSFIARNSAFYRPKLALIGQLHIMCPIRHFRCGINYFTHLSHLS